MAHRYFLTDIVDDTAFVRGEEALHLCKVMRIKQGDNIILCDKNGFDYHCTVQNVSDKEISFAVLSKEKNPAEPLKKVVVYMALAKSDKLEFVVQKACELGATTLIPFVSEYCIAQKSKKEDNKKARLQKISNEACKQSGRAVPMQVLDTITFAQLAQDMKNVDYPLFFYEHSTKKLSDINLADADNIAIIIGSEGGFSEKEALLLQQNGADSLTLGKRILRCETAAVAAISIVMYASGEME